MIENVTVPRHYFSKINKNTSKIQLHIFVDAREETFAAVAYFRVEDDNGVDVAFVPSKCKILPLKQLSIPKLGSQSAQMGTRIGDSIEK